MQDQTIVRPWTRKYLGTETPEESSGTRTVIEDKIKERMEWEIEKIPKKYLPTDKKKVHFTDLMKARNGNTQVFAQNLLNNNWDKYPLVYIFGMNDIGKDQLAASYMITHFVHNLEHYQSTVIEVSIPNHYKSMLRVEVENLANPQWVFWRESKYSTLNSKLVVFSGFGDDIEITGINPGTETRDKMKRDAMQQTIQYIYDHGIRCIITTNYNPKSTIFDSHIIGRIKELTNPFFFSTEMDGKGWR